MHVAVVRADRDRHRRELVQQVAGIVRVHDRPRGDAVLVAHDERVRVLVVRVDRIDVVLELDDIVLAVRGLERVGRSRYERLVRHHLQAGLVQRIGRKAGQEYSILIADVRGLEHDLELSAVLLRVCAEQVMGDVRSGAALHAEELVPVRVRLIPAILPVEVLGNSQLHVAVFGILPQPVRAAVRHTGRVEIEREVRCDRSDGVAELLDVHLDGERGRAAGDRQHVYGHNVRLVRPYVAGSRQMQRVHKRAVDAEFNGRVLGPRVVHDVRDRGRVVLTRRNRAEVVEPVDTPDDRRVQRGVVPDDVLEDVICLDVRAVHDSGDPALQKVRPVCLGRDGVRLQDAGCVRGHRRQLDAVQLEMHDLRDRAVGRVCEVHGTANGVRVPIRERGLKPHVYDLDGPRLHVCAATVVCDIQDELLGADGAVIGHIERVPAMLQSAAHDDGGSHLQRIRAVNGLFVAVHGGEVDHEIDPIRRRCYDR